MSGGGIAPRMDDDAKAGAGCVCVVLIVLFVLGVAVVRFAAQAERQIRAEKEGGR